MASDAALASETRPKTTLFRRSAPWLSRLVLFPPIIIFTAISLRYFTNPAGAIPGTTLGTPLALTDTRVLGAWTLTLLILLMTFLLSKERLWLGHLQLVFFMGATLMARIFGFLHDGTTLAMGNQRVITIVEFILLTLNAVGLLLQIQLRSQSEARS